jgi:RNA recognition motif-containing protein
MLVLTGSIVFDAITGKVYVGNLGNNASKNELESSFSKYGPLKNVWVARNPPGFAFIEFEDPRGNNNTWNWKPNNT